MPINVALESYHETRLDTLTLGKVSDCCPYIYSYLLLVGKDFSNLTDFLS